MKTIRCILVAIFLCVIISCIPKSRENDLFREGLKGNVLSIRVIKYDAIEKNGVIEKGVVRFSYCTLYTKNGEKIETTWYDSIGQLYAIEKYTYNNNGNMIEKGWYDSKEIVTNRKELIYDNKGNKITENLYNSENELTDIYQYTYNLKENLIEYTHIYDEGKGYKYKYTHNNNGNIIEENVYDLEGKLVNKLKYVYNANGNIIKEVSYNWAQKLEYLYKYTYDAYGNEIESDSWSVSQVRDRKSVV